MSKILSIQSHVAYGYVGNRAAVFPLQCLGYDVTAINTVQFSNHTGYGQWQGDVMSMEHIQNIINGLRDLGQLYEFDAILTGYMGDVSLAEIVISTINEIRQVNPDLSYCCDPVMGDIGRGFFVRDTLPACFKDEVIQYANIITPNQFEATYLSGVAINNLDDALKAGEQLVNIGPEIVLITSLQTEETPDGMIQMLVYSTKSVYLITTPKFFLDPAPNGSGDMTTAIFYAKYLATRDLKIALESTASSIYGIFEVTHKKQTRELQMIDARHEITQPSNQFIAEQLR